jgi:hypothetical protein
VAIRALALDASLRKALIAKLPGKPTLDPFSDRRPDWLSLNDYTAEDIREVAHSSGIPEAIALVDPVIDYALGKSFDELCERRGTDFHRWRPQSYGIVAVPAEPAWTYKENERSMGIGFPVNEAAKGLAEEVTKIADAAMFALADAMDEFLKRLPAASPRLGGPEL